MCFSLFAKCRSSSNSGTRAPSSSSSTKPKRMPKSTGSSDKFPSPPPPPPEEFNSTSTTSSSSLNNNNHNRRNKFSNSSTLSLSSRTSLSSIRDLLPPSQENPHIYDLSQIRSATENFRLRPSHSSSSSTSWRCSLSSKPVVVTQRKLRTSSSTQPSPPALRDLLHLISRSNHSSLVRLHGAAVSGNFVYLVHDLVLSDSSSSAAAATSLADCLRNKRNPSFTPLSNWLSRVQIAADLADGLDYLHNSTGLVHNHVKTTSVLVVEEPVLAAKLCHLGTAQLCGEPVESVVRRPGGEGDEEGEIRSEERGLGSIGTNGGGGGGGTVKLEGTRGYMSPEFQATGFATRKSDVYAFGVVVLELLTGEEPLKFTVSRDGGGEAVYRRVSLVETGREVAAAGAGSEGGDIGGGCLRKWVDWRLRDSYPVDVVERMVKLAVECCDDDPNKRPGMGRVAGLVSKMLLESKNWAERIGLPTDFTVSLAPR